MMSRVTIAQEVFDERTRQIQKWGKQHHLHGGHRDREFWAQGAELFRQFNDDNDDPGWDDILMEEIAEAFAESDLAKRRAELIQCAAVIFAEVEDIDTPDQPSLSETFSQNLLP